MGSTAPATKRENPAKAVQAAYAALRQGYEAERFPTAEVREDRLERLLAVLQRERVALCDAINEDFGGRLTTESLMSDVLMSVEAVKGARDQTRAWMKRRPVAPQWYSRPGKAWIEPQPLGVVAIIAPWNYPVALSLSPLAPALAAGNRALIKPSELTPKTSEVLARLIADTFTPAEVAVVTGGPEVAQAVTHLPVDHLFFTGSTAVGKLVALAAAQNLTPVTLELGGKSPAIVHPSFPLEVFAQRIAMGKLFNGGQTCIAPDYVLVPRGQASAFGRLFTDAVRASVGEAKRGTLTSVASDKGLSRIEALLDDAARKGARVEETLPRGEGRHLAPVLLHDVTDEMLVMQEEIFGPVLPVVPVDDVDAAIDYVNARPRPLSLYYFDRDSGRASDVLRRTTAGGVCLNDTLLHFAQKDLPFGGVGPSGMGRYHGQTGFDSLSNLKGVFEQSRLSATPFMLGLDEPLLTKAIDFFIGGDKRRPGQ